MNSVVILFCFINRASSLHTESRRILLSCGHRDYLLSYFSTKGHTTWCEKKIRSRKIKAETSLCTAILVYLKFFNQIHRVLLKPKLHGYNWPLSLAKYTERRQTYRLVCQQLINGNRDSLSQQQTRNKRSTLSRRV